MFDVLVQAGAGGHRFLAGWAGEGWPADVERLAQLAPSLEVVFAKDLSEGAREWLSEHLLGWVDETGRANISLDSGLVVLTTPPVPARIPPLLRSGTVPQVTAGIRRRLPTRSTSRFIAPVGHINWTPATIAAAEAALAGTPPTVEAIERATGLSRGATANSLARLEHLGLLDRPATRRGRGSARRIPDPNRLLDEYAIAAGALRARRPVVLVHRLWDDPVAALASEIGPALGRARVRWAATGAVASTLLAPYLTAVTVLELYVDADLFFDRSRLADLLGGRVVEQGHRIEVRELPAATSATGPVINGIQMAMPARVYADLMAEGGRAAEAAHHLRETLNVGTTS